MRRISWHKQKCLLNLEWWRKMWRMKKKTHQASTITFSLWKIEGVKVFFSSTEETEKNRRYTTISYLDLDYLVEYFFFFLSSFIYFFFLLLFLSFFFFEFEFTSSLIIIMIFYFDPMPVYIFLLKWARKIMVNMLSVWFASKMKEEKSIFLRKFFFVGSCNEIYTFIYSYIKCIRSIHHSVWLLFLFLFTRFQKKKKKILTSMDFMSEQKIQS